MIDVPLFIESAIFGLSGGLFVYWLLGLIEEAI